MQTHSTTEPFELRPPCGANFIGWLNSRSLAKFLSPQPCDPYGRARPISRQEVIFHALARLVVIGFLLGFGWAISLRVVRAAASASHGNIHKIRISSLEGNS